VRTRGGDRERRGEKRAGPLFLFVSLPLSPSLPPKTLTVPPLIGQDDVGRQGWPPTGRVVHGRRPPAPPKPAGLVDAGARPPAAPVALAGHPLAGGDGLAGDGGLTGQAAAAVPARAPAQGGVGPGARAAATPAGQGAVLGARPGGGHRVAAQAVMVVVGTDGGVGGGRGAGLGLAGLGVVGRGVSGSGWVEGRQGVGVRAEKCEGGVEVDARSEGGGASDQGRALASRPPCPPAPPSRTDPHLKSSP